MIAEGIILLDSEAGTELGFTCDRFEGWLWKQGDYIVISFIKSTEPGRGNFVRLLEKIHAEGYGIMVPTAFTEMARILDKRKFEKSEVQHNGETYEVWKLPPSGVSTC